MQVVIKFAITVKPSNAFEYLPIPNLQWLLQIADKKESGMIYYEIFLKKPSVSNSQHFSLADRNIKLQLGFQIKLPTGRKK